MKHLFLLSVILLLFSCNSPNNQDLEYRTDFTQQEQKILDTSRKVIKDCYYGTLITIDQKGQPRARTMEPFTPEKDFIIWLATNPKSRKVDQIKNNKQVTMYYFDKTQMGYVSLMGNAFIVNDQAIKNEKWKDGWDKFYSNKKEAYLLIKFVPEVLELISFPNGYNGDENTWQPHQVILRN